MNVIRKAHKAHKAHKAKYSIELNAYLMNYLNII